MPVACPDKALFSAHPGAFTSCKKNTCYLIPGQSRHKEKSEGYIALPLSEELTYDQFKNKILFEISNPVIKKYYELLTP